MTASKETGGGDDVLEQGLGAQKPGDPPLPATGDATAQAQRLARRKPALDPVKPGELDDAAPITPPPDPDS